MNLFDFDDSAIRQTNVHKISKISPKNATISPAEIFPGHLRSALPTLLNGNISAASLLIWDAAQQLYAPTHTQS